MSSNDEDRVWLKTARFGGLPLVRHAQFHDEVTSTNDLALRAASDAMLPTPALIVAERQTAGRGRGANRWWSAPGALTFSIILETGNHLPPALWPRVSLACAVAVCDAIEQVEPGIRCRVKWPNDVFVAERKICGILVEVPNSLAGESFHGAPSSTATRRPTRPFDARVEPTAPRRIVLGIGVNVNNSWNDAPPDLHTSGIALRDVTGRPHDLMDVLRRALAALDARLDQLQRHDIQLSTAWRSRCHLAGRHVRLSVGNRSIEGRCEGIDRDGALLVVTAAHREKIVSGVVTCF
jgi:BirA family biotin operon repressor/biotin-[acetyl-CoA-carboxylase] ligase